MKDIHNNQPVSCRKKFQLTDTIKNAIVYKKNLHQLAANSYIPVNSGRLKLLHYQMRPKTKRRSA